MTLKAPRGPKYLIRMAAVLFTALSPALTLPASSRAMTDYSAPQVARETGDFQIGASPSLDGRGSQFLQSVAPVTMAPRTTPVSTEQASNDGIELIIKGPEEDQAASSDDRLTSEEIRKIREVIEPGKSSALQVALVNIAVKGTSLLMYFFIWCVGLWILRREFNFWFDEDVYRETWPSVTVIAILLVCTAWVLVSTVQ